MPQFKNNVYWACILTILAGIPFLSCKKHPTEPLGIYPLKVVETKGYEVPQDSIEPPKIIPVVNPRIVPIEKHKVESASGNVHPVGKSQVVAAGMPKVATPGQDSFSLPKIVPAIDSPFVAGLPKIVPAKEVAGIDPNPENFSAFNKLQGLGYTSISAILADKSGNLWFGTGGGGAARYDGLNFTLFSQQEGLSNNNISCLYEDEKGNIWFGTWGGGVTKYNGQNFTHFTTKEGLSNDYVFSITGDRSGNLWVGTLEGGVSKYDGKKFAYFTTKEGLCLDRILYIIEDRNGNLWMGSDGGGVSKYDGKSLPTGQASFTNYTTNEGLSNNVVTCITEDKNGHIWFGTQGGGISEFDGQHFSYFNQKDGLPNDFVLSMIADKAGNIWFSNAGGGVTKYDGENFTYYKALEGLRANQVQAMMEDKNGNIWFGTADDGISKYNGQGIKYFTKKDGLANRVSSVIEDKTGNTWIGIVGGGVLEYDGKKKLKGQAEFLQLIDKDATYSNLVTRMLIDKTGNLWFGSWGGGIVKYDGKNFTHFTENEGLSGNRVISLMEDKSGNIWIGTDFGGASKYDGKTFTNYTTKEGLSHNIVSGIVEDKNGNLWFSTKGGGVSKFDGQHFTHFAEKQGLSNEILSITVAQNGNLWFGTLNDGVVQYDGKNFTYFGEKEGLSNHVYSVTAAQDGTLWFSSDLGLFKLTLAKQAELTEKIKLGATSTGNSFFTNYTNEDGSFTAGMMYEANDGALWLGSGDRLTVFNPEILRADTVAPNLQLTNVALFTENIAWGQLAHKKDTSITLGNGVKLKDFQLDSLSSWYNVPQGLSLAYNNNYLTFNFTGITLQSPKMVKYQYQLDGLEDQWSAISTHNEATYGNLSPGTYTFKVKAMKGEDVWSKELGYTFTIRPPWWRTWWAYFCYLLLIGGSIFGLYRFELKQRLQQAEALRLKELDAVKTKLYTNITHEFRTPLTVILGMAQQVLDNPKDYFREGLKMIMRNGQNLLTLVNQMLDLSKLESGKLPLHYHRADIVAFLQYIVESFHSLAENKGVTLHFIPDEEELMMDYDEVRMQQIVSNILSNAIKFTPKEGHVYIWVNTQNDRFVLKIKDTGIGIAEADIPLIFDRFYQSDGTHTRQGEGTGIGLALTRELVKLMDGTIAVKSHQGKGAEFEVTFPLQHHLEVEEKQVKAPVLTSKTIVEAPDSVDEPQVLTDNKDSDLPHILIADDNEDVRTYLASCLKNDYIIEIAKNGQECEDIAFNTTPDLIILDVMMPLKDGFEVCKTLKTDERTSHIPIIMLTAKADMDSRLEGLEQGADDYLSKPFHKKELLLRIRNLLELRRQLQQYYRSSLEVNLSNELPPLSESPTPSSDIAILKAAEQGSKNPSVPLANSLENAFVIKVRKTIEANLEAPDFDVEKLCRTLAMSHSQVHRKLSALTGLSATHFIRYVRLVKAKEMIIHSGYSLAAIAIDCGFNDPAYFSRIFKQEFGVSPQVWREQNAV